MNILFELLQSCISKVNADTCNCTMIYSKVMMINVHYTKLTTGHYEMGTKVNEIKR